MERGFDNMIDALERDGKKAKALHELSPERQALVEQREQQTDKVYQLRTQLASFLRSNRAALYDVYGEPWETKKHALEILAELAEARANGKTVEEVLKIKVDRRDRAQYKLLAALKRALDVYAELKSVVDPAGLKEDGSDAAQIDRYYKMRFGNIGQAMWVRDEMNEQAQRLQKEREEVLKTSSDPDVLEAIDEDIADLQRRADVYFSSNPEAWITARAMRLHEMKKTFDENGRIVQTPYVREKMAEIQASIKAGRPVFIIGELGSGKTEIAKELAYQKLSLPHLKRWDALHPEPDLLNKEAHDAWLAQRREQREAIVVAGHRSIEIDTLLAGREVRRKEAPLPEEQLAHMRRTWKSYAERMGIADAEEARERETFEKVYIEFFRAPIETNVVFGGLLRAMREGRPFILDEMNAVPHMILIAFNDLLMRKPGDLVQVQVPGAEPFRVQEGFCFIGTGNYKPEDGKRYVGRQQLDAAFLSRLDTVSYDYLPMSIETGSQEDLEKNELFHMLVARLVDRDLSVRIPEGALEKIKGICRAARVLQNVISDRDVSESFYATVAGSKVNPNKVLQENVLSIRHLIPIIDAWKQSGYTQSLEDLLYARYVSKSDARPQEKAYIYWTLQTLGEVFPPGEGWPDAIADQNALQGFQGVQKRMYGEHAYTGGAVRTEKKEMKWKYYSPKALVEVMYGSAPARKKINEEVFEARKKGKMLSPEAQLHIGNAMDQIHSLFKKLVEVGEFAET